MSFLAFRMEEGGVAIGGYQILLATSAPRALYRIRGLTLDFPAYERVASATPFAIPRDATGRFPGDLSGLRVKMSVGSVLLSGDPFLDIELWNVSSEPTALFSCTTIVHAVGFSPNGIEIDGTAHRVSSGDPRFTWNEVWRGF